MKHAPKASTGKRKHTVARCVSCEMLRTQNATIYGELVKLQQQTEVLRAEAERQTRFHESAMERARERTQFLESLQMRSGVIQHLDDQISKLVKILSAKEATA